MEKDTIDYNKAQYNRRQRTAAILFLVDFLNLDTIVSPLIPFLLPVSLLLFTQNS